jgi:hypothetical protein
MLQRQAVFDLRIKRECSAGGRRPISANLSRSEVSSRQPPQPEPGGNGNTRQEGTYLPAFPNSPLPERPAASESRRSSFCRSRYRPAVTTPAIR